MAERHPRHVGRLFKQIDEALERIVNNDMRPHGITLSQMHVLMDLWESDEGELGFKQLEASMGVAQSTVWGLVTRLEAKGLVESVTSPDDARAKRARITDAGRRTCLQCRADMDRHEQMLIGDLSPDEVQELSALLQRILASLTQQ